jgi:hypothetical protein
MKYASNIDLNRNELQNAVTQRLATAPASPVEGLRYYDTVLKQEGYWNGTGWIYTTAGAAGAVTKVVNASAAGVLQVSGGADKSIADFTSTGGIAKVSAAGVVSIAAPGTDYVTAGSTNTLTNKTIDTAANSIINLGTGNFAVNVVDADVNLTANSDTRLATQKAAKAYIDSRISSIGVPKGGIDCSTNPNYPAGIAGDYYRVTVAGLIGGAAGIAVTVGDVIECFVAGIAGTQAAVGANWSIIQANVDQATLTTLGLTAYATSAEADAKTIGNKALTPNSLTNYPTRKIFTFGDGVATSYALAHNLNSFDVVVQFRDATSNAMIQVDYTNTSANVVTVTPVTAPATNSIKATIIG